MLDIITVIMHYYFQSGFRSVWCQPNAGSLVELSTWALGKWALCPWLPGMGAWELKASGWAVSQAILAQSSKNTSFSPEAEITALWSGIVQGCVAHARGERARPVVLQESEWGGQAGRAQRSLQCLCGGCRCLLLWCFPAFVVVIFMSSLQGTRRVRRKNTTAEEKKQL